jgi:predicted lipoprotein with Yx(FWY)xxD motif
MKTLAILCGLLVATTLALAGITACAGGDDADNSAAAAPPAEAGGAGEARATTDGATRRRGATLTARRTRYGTVLADGKGRVLYEFTRDGTANRSRCYGDCAVAWPPFYTRGTPRVRGIASEHLGTTRRRDGRRQVTYRGKPLYYYVTDTRPGQVTCQAVPEFGGTWYVTNPDGTTNLSPR